MEAICGHSTEKRYESQQTIRVPRKTHRFQSTFATTATPTGAAIAGLMVAAVSILLDAHAAKSADQIFVMTAIDKAILWQ